MKSNKIFILMYKSVKFLNNGIIIYIFIMFIDTWI